jgi:aminopeptidase N
MGNGGYDVTQYDIQLAVDVASNTITATTTIQAQATQALRTFNLDFRDLVIDDLRVNGQPASFSVATWQDLWLREGFSHYCWWLWLEQTKGEKYFQQYLRSQYSWMQQKRMWAPAQPRMGYLLDWPVYTRTAWTLHALRLHIGDESFFRLLHTWVERHQYGNASTADFMALAEEVSGQELDALFQIWLYGNEIPPMPELTL